MKKMLNNKVKKIKNKLKKIVRWFYKKKFASMIEPSIIFLKREEFERAAQHDKKIIKYLSKLSKPTRLNRNKKRAVAKIVVQYINLLDAVTIYQQDSMVNNQSLKVYSQSVINGTLDSRVFIPYDWSNFINALMKANARVYNRDTYKYLYDNFVSKYPDMRKARAISQLLWLNVGYIDLKNEIVPLLERFESVMEYLENKGYKRNHKKYDQILYRTTAYISQILRISDMCF